MSQCIVIGEASVATQTVRSLRSKGVIAKALEATSNHDVLIETCAREPDLKVIAIFLSSLRKDVPALLRSIQEKLDDCVCVHILCDRDDQLSSFAKNFADEVTAHFPMGHVEAEKVLMARWFSGVQKKPGNQDFKKRTGGTVHWNHADKDVKRVPPPIVLTGRRVTLSELESFKAGLKGGEDTLLAERPVDAVHADQPVKVVTGPSPFVALEQGNDEAMLTSLLSGLKKNSLAPEVPAPVRVIGCHGMTIELDPRRVRPLPENPRHVGNPGFTEESLRKLGEQIKTFGQLEDISVCPIEGDTQYDAQLIDGERRHAGCTLAGVMIRANVREDVSADDSIRLYILSVVRNTSKEPHTTQEYISMVQTLMRSPYSMSRKEIAKTISKVPVTVAVYEQLATLHPDVIKMIGETRMRKSKKALKESPESGELITMQIGQLLVRLPREQQLEHAKTIVAEHMSYNQARRYVLDIIREKGVKRVGDRKGRWSKTFQSIKTAAKRNIDVFGSILDMSADEMAAMLANRTPEEIKDASAYLRTLSSNLLVLADRIGVKG